MLVSWCDVFTAWLEAEENEDGVERLLEEMKPAVKVVIAVSSRSLILSFFGLFVLCPESDSRSGGKYDTATAVTK